MRRRILTFFLAILLLFSINPCQAKAVGTSAAAAILVDADSGRVLYDQNADARMLIASTTKIMTALVAIREGNLSDVVTVKREATLTEGSSMYLKEGEKLTLETLLYGLMLCSGNDAAVAIAEHVGGSVDTPWKESVRKRLPWLVVNMVNSALSASVVYMFEGSIAQMAALAVLMPMVANQAGNTGQQALAVMIRQLATDRFETKKAWMAVLREAKIGLVTGLFMAMLALCGAWGFTGNPLVGMVMAGALLCDMMLGAVAGGSIPLIFRALGRDPAQASSIFLTTITDGAGFFIFLGLATMFLF